MTRSWPVLILTALCASVMATTASAQTIVEAHAGRSWFVDEAWFDVPHVAAGVAFRQLVSPRVRLGARVTYMRGPGRDRDWFMMGDAVFDIRRADRPRAVAPYWFVSLGLMRHSNKDGRRRPVNYGPAFDVGIGARIRTGRNTYVAPEGAFGVLITRVGVSVGWSR